MMRVVSASDSAAADRLRMKKSSGMPSRSRWRWRSRAVMSSSTSGIASADSAWTMIIRTEPRKGVPNTLRWAVVSGMIMVSSWSRPSRFWPLAAEHADDDEGALLDADGLADRVFVAEQVLGDRLADQRDPRRRTHIGIAEGRTIDDVPGARLEIGRRRADDRACSSSASHRPVAACPGASAPHWRRRRVRRSPRHRRRSASGRRPRRCARRRW